MINAAEAIVGGFKWASMTSCLTPNVLFCILNLTIVTIFITSTLKKPQELGDDEDSSPPQLMRVKCINFSTYSCEQPEPFDSAASHTIDPPQEPTQKQKSECVEESPVTRSKSNTCVNDPAKRVLKKSASAKVSAAEPEEEKDRLRPATVRETTSCNGTEDEEVDAKADDFINRFRQQLKLQRMESNLRCQETTNRLRN